MNSKKESNMTKIKWLEKQIIRFLKIFEKKVGLIDENAAHGSDALESAAREIAYFFTEEEICPRTR